MRRAAKVDANQPDIVRELRRYPGLMVEHLHTLGRGRPDIMVGFRGRNYLFEIKTDGGELTDQEDVWIASWTGHVEIARSAADVLEAIGMFASPS